MAILEDYPSTNTPLSASVLFNAIYPVGCIYQTTDGNFNPNTDFGIGTWVQIKDKFLLSAGDTYTGGDTGGSATHTHSLENDSYAKLNINQTGVVWMAYKLQNWTEDAYGTVSAGNRVTHTSDSNNTAMKLGGTTDSGSTMPPYVVVYTWNRTA